MKFGDLSKRFFTHITETIREELKIQIDLENYKSTIKTYEQIKESFPSNAFGLSIKSDMNLKGSILIDPMMIYTLANKMWGGPGLVEVRPESIYTESEKVMGNILSDWTEQFFTSKDFLNVTIKPIFEGSPNSSFFEDDKLFIAEFIPILKKKKMDKFFLCLESEGD